MSFRKAALLAGLFTAMIAVASAATPPGIPDGWTDGYVYANGIRVHYYHAVPAPLAEQMSPDASPLPSIFGPPSRRLPVKWAE
jgi:hypothetical protein